MTTILHQSKKRKPKSAKRVADDAIERTADRSSALQISEWINRAIPAGSGRYYAMLHADDDAREHLQAVTALIGIWSQTAFGRSEPEIALRKIDWWRAEIAGEHCEHPLTRLLLPNIDSKKDLRPHLLDILKGYAELLQYGSPSTDEANKLFHWSTGAIACLALTGAENTVNNPVARAGVALSRFRCLRCLPEHINAKLLCLPMSLLEAESLSPAQFQPGSDDPTIITFFSRQLQTLDLEMKAVADELLHAGAGARPLYVYLCTQQRLLKKLMDSGANLLQPRVRLSPIRNYFVAFRAARQHYRAN